MPVTTRLLTKGGSGVTLRIEETMARQKKTSNGSSFESLVKKFAGKAWEKASREDRQLVKSLSAYQGKLATLSKRIHEEELAGTARR